MTLLGSCCRCAGAIAVVPMAVILAEAWHPLPSGESDWGTGSPQCDHRRTGWLRDELEKLGFSWYNHPSWDFFQNGILEYFRWLAGRRFTGNLFCFYPPEIELFLPFFPFNHLQPTIELFAVAKIIKFVL